MTVIQTAINSVQLTFCRSAGTMMMIPALNMNIQTVQRMVRSANQQHVLSRVQRLNVKMATGAAQMTATIKMMMIVHLTAASIQNQSAMLSAAGAR